MPAPIARLFSRIYHVMIIDMDVTGHVVRSTMNSSTDVDVFWLGSTRSELEA